MSIDVCRVLRTVSWLCEYNPCSVNVSYCHLLSAYFMPGDVQDAGDVEIDEMEKVPVLRNIVN